MLPANVILLMVSVLTLWRLKELIVPMVTVVLLKIRVLRVFVFPVLNGSALLWINVTCLVSVILPVVPVAIQKNATERSAMMETHAPN